MSNIYSNVKDHTMQRGGMQPGLLVARECWTCRKPKTTAGGQINKRTRLWQCAGCKAPAK